jgi:hypothetical protein
MKVSKNLFALIYLCIAIPISLFIMSLLFKAIGKLIGYMKYNDLILDMGDIILPIKLSILIGIPLGFVLWFFFYRNIR